MPGQLLVAGSDGYIGTLLCRRLADDFDVTGFDAGYYRDAYLFAPTWALPRTITGDIRRIAIEDLAGVTAVACLSDLTDPLSQAFPELARAINCSGLARFARLCKPPCHACPYKLAA